MNRDAARRNRRTGTIVVLIDNRDGLFSDDLRLRWWNVCEEHGTCIGHETKQLALDFMAVPWEWCEDCRA